MHKFSVAQPSTSTSKSAVVIKEENSPNDSTDRTHFVLVSKPKFIKVESVNDAPASPRKTQNVTIETEDDEDVAMMKGSQESDEGT